MKQLKQRVQDLSQRNLRLQDTNTVLEDALTAERRSLPGYLAEMPKPESVKQSRFPNGFYLHAIRIMGKCQTPASQVINSIKIGWEAQNVDTSLVKWPSNSLVGRARSSIFHLCRVHIGWVLTAAVRAGDTNWCINQDGTPENQRHVSTHCV